MKTEAIVLAAGEGRRLNTRLPKALVELAGKPIVAHSLEALAALSCVDSLVLVGHPGYLADFEALGKTVAPSKSIKVIAGGQQRADSVRLALAVLEKDTEAVVIHDGARPFLDGDRLGEAVELIGREPAVIFAVPVKPTIKKVDRQTLQVIETIDRTRLWEVQTPQIFRRDVICEAHARFAGQFPTDDSTLVEKLGRKVRVVEGEYANIKITTPEDLRLAGLIYAGRKGDVGDARRDRL